MKRVWLGFLLISFTFIVNASDFPKASIAILGGTFVNDELFNRHLIKSEFTVNTKLGQSAKIYYAEYKNTPFYYVHMHGEGKLLETWTALYDLGVKDVIGGATAGAINTKMKVYDYIVPTDFIDMNVDRPLIFPKFIYRDQSKIPLPRFTPAMDADLRAILLKNTSKALKEKTWNLHDGGVIVQARGGRFETVAEINMFAQWGGDVVTMNVPSEIVYARQLGINYAALIVISNPAEGKGEWDFSLMKTLYPKINPISMDIILDSLGGIAALGDKPRSLDGLINHPELTSKKQE
jgi:5'-methylthioadenosine phosphorylase